MSTSLDRIVAALNAELCMDEFEDASHNGLQVANASGRVRKVCCGVDATLAFFEEAARRKADLVVCHHGISWGDSLKRITHLNYRRLAFLIRHDIALYAAHLPLDAHPRLGNNARICDALGLVARQPFGRYHGRSIGFRGKLPRAVTFATLKKRIAKALGDPEPRVMEFGKSRVRTVAVVSGGAADLVEEAAREGIDVFLSGEPTLAAYHLAQEYGIHALFGGHYATETFGVKALADLIARRFKLPCEFIDTAIPF